MQRGSTTVERLDGQAAAHAEDAFRLIYAEAFTEPPYEEPPEDIEAAFRDFPAHTRRPGFRATLARTPHGDPVGMAYGWTLPPDTPW